ncbi:MAG: 4Fe-4S dicluster domain-containing protein [Deltaproteobacteria bacterium]|nr:4Fe-4S dicluster domain-containing protein [Deltaproteobacteria bacterium]MBW2594721.1 4Fe-4S dicluster domain-containing protein [Deltaproteobacteria bacterium]MBW2650100.1 4Fe-4S dicluster domain-containing protein [Deltaproteobacteria bacterium]
MTEDIFRALQKRLDKYSLGFPATDIRVELEILKKLFTEGDAAMFLELTPMLESPESIAPRVSRSAEDVAAQLEDMARRGLLFRLQRGDSVKYGAIPFVHGLFEFQVKRLDRDMAELVERYGQIDFKEAIIKNADSFLRTIPVERSIDVTQNIAAYDDACEMLRNMKKIVVTDCICRKQKGLIDKGCGKPLEACFMFGSMGQYYLDNKMGREVDADEAIRILTKAQEAGLVTQPATSQNPSGMCNCCGDCCGILNALNTLPNPAEYVFSNHFAVIDQEACSGCEVCIDRCQMGAVKMNDDDVAQINPDRCIGCGLCVTTCPTDALQLVPKPEEKRRTPPANNVEQMMAMAEKRGIQF